MGLSFTRATEAIPGLAAQFLTVVPDGYWDRENEWDAATVRCPCGHSPELTRGVPCACRCDRWFLDTGRSVRVARYEGWRERVDLEAEAA